MKIYIFRQGTEDLVPGIMITSREPDSLSVLDKWVRDILFSIPESMINDVSEFDIDQFIKDMDDFKYWVFILEVDIKNHPIPWVTKMHLFNWSSPVFKENFVSNIKQLIDKELEKEK